MIKDFDQMLQKAKSGKIMSLVAAAAEDDFTLKALYMAEKAGFISPVLVGDEKTIKDKIKHNELDFKHVEVVHAGSLEESAYLSVQLIKEKKADFLMKGLLDTSIFLKAIINKSNGLSGIGLLNHVMTFETSGHYHKLLITSDGGMIICPDLEQKKKILQNTLGVVKALEIDTVKVGIICAKEKVSPKMTCTVDAEELKKLGDKGYFGDNVIVEGPISFDIAISDHWAKIKGFQSQVAGDIDIALMPNIEAGNVLGKTLTALYDAKAAGVVMGCDVPIIMTSRADDDYTKLASIALGCLIAKQKTS